MNYLKAHTNEIVGFIGTTMTLIMPILKELGLIIQILGGLGGLVLLGFSIHNKRLQIKKNQMELKNLNNDGSK